MGVDNTWAETSAPVSMHPTAASEDTLSLFTYPSRHSTSPTSPVLTDSASQHYTSSWDSKQSAAPETPPSPNDPGHYVDHQTFSTDLEPYYSSVQDSQDDIKDPCGAPGVCGLRNLGNTCFMSAGIQCLSNTPTLLHFFLLGSQIDNIPINSLTAQFSCLLHRLWSGQMKVVHPGEFKHELGSTYPQFKDYRQHDCQEFLALLLDSLHEQLNAAHLSNIFKIEMKSQSLCPASVSTTPACTPPKVLREKNEFPVKPNSVSSTTQLHYYLKDSKTSNVNVAVEDEEPNNTIKYDSDKYPRADLSAKQRDAHPKHNLSSTYDFDNKTVSTKRLKETNLFQDRSAGGGTSGEGLDFKRIKLTDQNNCCKGKSCVQDSEVSGSATPGSIDTLKHPNNSVLSIVNGINKCVNEKSLKCEGTDDEQSSKEESHNSTDELAFPKEDVQADEDWEKHLALNQSIVVDSFLGQFKSTVICSECKHISVTHEPFMYLSVPLPHAMERQIKIVFVPALDPVAVEYLVTVNKQDSVRQLGEAVIALRASESYSLPEGATIVLAEGFPNRISKTLDECVPLRQVNDRDRRIYAIEMLPPPSGCSIAASNLEVSSSEDLPFPLYPGMVGMHQYNRDDYWALSPESEDNLYLGKKPMTEVNEEVDITRLPDSSTHDNLSADWGGKPCTATSEDVSSFGLEANDDPIIGQWDGDTDPPPLVSADFYDKKEQNGRVEPEWAPCSSGESSTQSATESSHSVFEKPYKPVSEQEQVKPNRSALYGPALPPANGGFEAWSDSQSRNNFKHRSGYGGSPDRNDECKQCAICLEDATKDMRRHVGCNIILCDNCIENASKHTHGSKGVLECPGCRKHVSYDQEFIRIDKLGDLKPAIRELTVPVVFRLDTEGDGNNNQKTFELIGYPKVLKLPSTLPAKDLNSAVGRLVHTDQPYSLLTVDGKGDHCSRCLYNKHCRGCRIATEGEVILRSGDTIAVRFTEPVDSQIRKHDSLNSQRLPDNKSLTLYDCLKAFSESELLDEHNPWFCPTCKKNQCATKTLSVCRYPDLLIVYLKRFVFHNGISTKLDNKVTYPLNNFIINPQSSHYKEGIVYDLYACVCHIGGISAGHYTAYAKNPQNSEWYHFNDENVVRQRPLEDDYSNAYILFYQKRGADFPEINQDSMKINQIIDELGSADNERSPRTSMIVDEVADGDGLINVGN